MEGGNELSATYPNGTVAPASESSLYPLEYLFVGGPAVSTLGEIKALNRIVSLLIILVRI